MTDGIQKQFDVLCGIARAQHFAWREAVQEQYPDADTRVVVERMWEIVGEQTGRAYARSLGKNGSSATGDEQGSLAVRIAGCIARSSQCMGEDAAVEPGATSGEAFVRHVACPWHTWHERLGLLEEDRPGCDAWFGATLKQLSESLGMSITFETLAALPDGDDACLRRISVRVDAE